MSLRTAAIRTHIVLAGESAGAAHVAAATLMRRFHPAGRPAHRRRLPRLGRLQRRAGTAGARQLGIATPDPRNEAYFGTDFAGYRAMSTVELIDAAPFPLAISYAELDPVQMQAQAGELFARLVTRHGFQPRIGVIRNHNHLSQVYSINSGDEALAGPCWPSCAIRRLDLSVGFGSAPRRAVSRTFLGDSRQNKYSRETSNTSI
jgi:acetyl esterase